MRKEKLNMPPESIKPLLTAVEQVISRFARNSDDINLLVVRANHSEFRASYRTLPEGFSSSSRKVLDMRHTVKGRRHYKNTRITSARWPEDKVETKRTPILAFTLRGQMDYRCLDYVVHCPEGSAILAPAGVPHPGASLPHLEGDHHNRSCDVLWLTPYGDDLLGCWLCHSEGKKHFAPGKESCYVQSQNLCVSFHTLVEQATAPREFSNLIAQSLMLVVLATIAQNLRDHNFFRWEPNTTDEQSSDAGHDPVRRACSYIQSHISTPLTLDRVAQAVYMSRSQFARQFHEQTGRTFVTYLTELRVEEARRLLRETSWSISSIAQYVGLKPRRFLQIFQEYEGLSPRAYRALDTNCLDKLK